MNLTNFSVYNTNESLERLQENVDDIIVVIITGLLHTVRCIKFNLFALMTSAFLCWVHPYFFAYGFSLIFTILRLRGKRKIGWMKRTYLT